MTARRQPTDAEIEQWAEQTAAQFPPLTDQQAHRVAALLAGTTRAEAAR